MYGIKKLEYENGKSIQSIVMGAGSVMVSDLLLNEDGFVGVAFSPAPENDVVGVNSEYDKKNQAQWQDIEAQMLFNNPASIDVVIDKLNEAKKSLID